MNCRDWTDEELLEADERAAERRSGLLDEVFADIVEADQQRQRWAGETMADLAPFTRHLGRNGRLELLELLGRRYDQARRLP